MKGMDLRVPTNALELQKGLMEAYTALRAGGISDENAKAQAALVRESINLMKVELLTTRILKVEPIYSTVRTFFGYDKKQISDNPEKEEQEKEKVKPT